MKFSTKTSFMLLGGGQLLADLVFLLTGKGRKTLVVTSQRHMRERVTGRSGITTLKEFLISNDIRYYVSRDVNTDPSVIRRISRNVVGISLGAAWIFKNPFIKKFNGMLLNVHGTRLPQNRGGGIFSWQVLSNSRLGFAMVHQIQPGIDTGPILKYKEYFYPTSCRIPEDYQRVYNANTCGMVRDFLEDIKRGKDFRPLEQQEYFSTYWPRLNTEIHGYIDWDWPLKDIELFICAFDNPYKGASTFVEHKRVFLKDCLTDFSDGGFHPFQKGIIYRKTETALFVAAEAGTLIVRSIKDVNGRDIFGKMHIGTRFYTPHKFLEKSKQYHALYTHKGLGYKP